MGLLLRSIVAIPILFVLVIVSFVMGEIVPPIAEVVLASGAVHAVGFASGMRTILYVGLRWVLPLLGLVVVLWWIFGSLRRDARQREVRR